MTKKTKKRARRKVSAKKFADKTGQGGFAHLQLPAGAKKFNFTKEGTYKLNVIPYEVQSDNNPNADAGELHFERTYFIHDKIGPDEVKVVCPVKSGTGKKCPVCEFRQREARRAKGDDELVKALAPKERQVFNFRVEDEEDEGIQIFDSSTFLFGKMLAARIRKGDEDEDLDSFADIEDGKLLRCETDEKKMPKGKMIQCSAIDFKPRKEELDDSLIDEAHDLDAVIENSTLPYKELAELFNQSDAAAEDDEDDEEEDDEDEDEEDEPPRKKKGSSKKRKRDEEEDDDDDEPPRKKRRRSTNEDDEDDDD